MVKLLIHSQVHEARFLDEGSSSGGTPLSPSQPTTLSPDTDHMDHFPAKTCPTLDLVEPLLSATTHAVSRNAALDEGDNRALLPEERTELLQMSYLTARGIHDAGWQRFGYWFATPEAWDQNGIFNTTKNSLIYKNSIII